MMSTPLALDANTKKKKTQSSPPSVRSGSSGAGFARISRSDPSPRLVGARVDVFAVGGVLHQR